MLVLSPRFARSLAGEASSNRQGRRRPREGLGQAFRRLAQMLERTYATDTEIDLGAIPLVHVRLCLSSVEVLHPEPPSARLSGCGVPDSRRRRVEFCGRHCTGDKPVVSLGPQLQKALEPLYRTEVGGGHQADRAVRLRLHLASRVLQGAKDIVDKRLQVPWLRFPCNALCVGGGTI